VDVKTILAVLWVVNVTMMLLLGIQIWVYERREKEIKSLNERANELEEVIGKTEGQAAKLKESLEE
jgi:hypothetical protein